MKLPALCLSVVGALMSAVVWADGTPQIYLNENFGFNVEGYNYTQAEYPCAIDKVLVEKIVERGQSNDLNIEAGGTAEKTKNAEVPGLPTTIIRLGSAWKNSTFGPDPPTNLPTVWVASRRT